MARAGLTPATVFDIGGGGRHPVDLRGLARRQILSIRPDARVASADAGVGKNLERRSVQHRVRKRVEASQTQRAPRS